MPVQVRDPKRPIIWIASYPKSGNTWLRAFLSRYYFGSAPFNLDLLGQLVVGANDMDFFVEANGGRPVFNDQFSTLREDVLLRQLSRRDHEGPVFFKTHNARVRHQGAQTIPPEITAKAIYIVRNPLDVVTSLACHLGIDVGEALDLMARDLQCLGGEGTQSGLEVLCSWSTHVRSWCFGEYPYPTLLVRYEDMLLRPQITFQNIIAFLDWPVDRDEIEKAISDTSFQALHALEAENGFRERPDRAKTMFFRRGVAGSWKDELSPEHAGAVMDQNRDVMSWLGYDLDPPKEPF